MSCNKKQIIVTVLFYWVYACTWYNSTDKEFTSNGSKSKLSNCERRVNFIIQLKQNLMKNMKMETW